MSYQHVLPPAKKLRNLDFNWEGKSVLDLGCNIGLVGSYVLANGASDYVGIEYNREFIKEARERNPKLKIYKTDVMEYSRYKSDVTVALAIFQHLDEHKIEKLLTDSKSKEYIIEVPFDSGFGEEEPPAYKGEVRYTRTLGFYEEKIKQFYGGIVEVVASGCPCKFPRVIFNCKKSL